MVRGNGGTLAKAALERDLVHAVLLESASIPHRPGTRFALRVEAGMTRVNDSPVNDEPNIAFGGVKASGIGRFGGEWAIREFSTEHWVSVQREPRSFPA